MRKAISHAQVLLSNERFGGVNINKQSKRDRSDSSAGARKAIFACSGCHSQSFAGAGNDSVLEGTCC